MTNERTEQWQLGVRVRAQGGEVVGIVAMLPVPKPWPEQDVKEVDRQISATVDSLRYKDLADSARQLVVAIPRLTGNQEAVAIVTLEITRRDIAAPKNQDSYRVPKRVSGAMRKYLKPSPYIESQDRIIRQEARTVTEEYKAAWSQAEAIYDWVRSKVEYRFDEQIKGARQALDDGFGDCEELTSLFIAMCRAEQIPARAVWVKGHCYPEFFLEDSKGKGQWFPCQAAGTRAFGCMSESRPILQKGDSFRLAGSRKPERYVKERLFARHATVSPVVEFICRPVQGNETGDSNAQ